MSFLIFGIPIYSGHSLVNSVTLYKTDVYELSYLQKIVYATEWKPHSENMHCSSDEMLLNWSTSVKSKFEINALSIYIEK